MSKERLEEIKSELKRSNNVGGIGNPGAEQMILDLHEIGRFEWLVKYAEEQSQRVQELEGYVEASTHIQRKLRKQNKRYREAIKRAISKFNYDEHQQGMSELLGALEESE